MLSNIRDKLSEHLGGISTTKIFMILFLLGIFIGLTYYVYRFYVIPKLDPDFVANKEFIPISKDDDTEPPTANLVYYYVKWCPHCKKATPEWDAVKTALSDQTVNGTIVTFEEVDCEKDSESKSKADEANVTCYPTIKLYKSDDTVIEYNAKPERDTLKEFLTSTL